MILKSVFPYLFGLFLFTSIFSGSCANDSEVITHTVHDTVVVTDTLITIDTITVIDSVWLTLEDSATTFILVRHAETTGGGSNPSLSTEGQARAEELKRVLSPISLNAVYSTNYNRTMETAQPTASDQGLFILNYDPSGLHGFVNSALAQHKHGNVLVVGHSNTTPSLLNVLIGSNLFSNLPETEYDNLYVVNVFEKGRAKVTHMKYGK